MQFRRLLFMLLVASFPAFVFATCPDYERPANCYWSIERIPNFREFSIDVLYCSGDVERKSAGGYIGVGCNVIGYRLASATPGNPCDYKMKLINPSCAAGFVPGGFLFVEAGCPGTIGDLLSFPNGLPYCGGTCPACGSGGGLGGGPGGNPPAGQPCCVPACVAPQECQACRCGAPCAGGCPNGQVCRDGACRQDCSNGQGCPNGQVCQNGACGAPCNPACKNGETCENGVCKPPIGCGAGQPGCADPNGDCDGDGVRNGCDSSCRPCEAVNGCCVDCGGDCKPKCTDPACSVANNYGCEDADRDGCCDACGACDCGSPRWPDCCKHNPNHPKYPKCDCGPCACTDPLYPACCLNDPSNPAYPECAPCSGGGGCSGCDPCVRLDIIIGLLSGASSPSDSGSGGSVPEPQVTKPVEVAPEKPVLHWDNLDLFHLGSGSTSTPWQIVIPIPNHSPWEITFGSLPSQWAFNGHPLDSNVAGALNGLRAGCRAVMALFVLFKLGQALVKLLFTL